MMSGNYLIYKHNGISTVKNFKNMWVSTYTPLYAYMAFTERDLLSLV
jgi:hypothetical protein